MVFSERKKLEKEYYNWLDKNKNVKACPMSLITFLHSRGNLVSKEQHDQIEILEKALELVCSDLLNERYPNFKKQFYKSSFTIKGYKYKAKRILGGGGNV